MQAQHGLSLARAACAAPQGLVQAGMVAVAVTDWPSPCSNEGVASAESCGSNGIMAHKRLSHRQCKKPVRILR